MTMTKLGIRVLYNITQADTNLNRIERKWTKKNNAKREREYRYMREKEKVLKVENARA